MRGIGFRGLVCVLLASGAMATPDSSLRPQARAAAEAPVLLQEAIRPMARPVVSETVLARQLDEHFQTKTADAFAQVQSETVLAPGRAFAAHLEQATTAQATGFSLRPFLRPDAVVRKAMAKRQERARGAVCGDPALQGEVVGFVPGRVTGCGIENAVRLRSVSGIRLSQQALMDCATAKAFRNWVDKGMKPSFGDFRGGVAQIRVAAHYACRGRNNQAGARISEHGKGRAIDVSGFDMRDGSQITVLKDWSRQDTGARLRAMHKKACGIFGTVLGPQSDRFHQDHFHFDTARYRSGSFCR